MNLVSKFKYSKLQRHTQVNGPRHYVCPSTGQMLPSVTTIIDKTSDKSGLLEWRKRVGDKEADRITQEALGLGTLMHTHLECHIAGIPRPGGNNTVRLQAEAMANQIIEHGLSNIEDVYGSEVSLYYPSLYAGTADGVALVHDFPMVSDTWVDPGQLSIIDFKSARKMKKREYIENYFIQLCAYGFCHDQLYDTNIKQGIIYMVDRDLQFKQFVLNGEEYRHYQNVWLDRLDRFYEMTGTV